MLDRQQEAGRRGFSGVRKVTEAERSFVFVLIKTWRVFAEFCSVTSASGDLKNMNPAIVS